MENYFSVEREVENEIVIEHSRFIAFVKNTHSEEQARDFIAQIKKKHSLATHNCFGFVTERGAIKRFSDDGEPSGTAGAPILEAINSLKLVNTTVVVTRYFGGIKLGAGGLTRAYSKSASEALKMAGRIEKVACKIFETSVSYEQFKKVERSLAKSYVKVLNIDYSENVNVRFAVKESEVENLVNLLSENLSFCPKLNYVLDDFVQLTVL